MGPEMGPCAAILSAVLDVNLLKIAPPDGSADPGLEALAKTGDIRPDDVVELTGVEMNP